MLTKSQKTRAKKQAAKYLKNIVQQVNEKSEEKVNIKVEETDNGKIDGQVGQDEASDKRKLDEVTPEESNKKAGKKTKPVSD